MCITGADGLFVRGNSAIQIASSRARSPLSSHQTGTTAVPSPLQRASKPRWRKQWVPDPSYVCQSCWSVSSALHYSCKCYFFLLLCSCGSGTLGSGCNANAKRFHSSQESASAFYTDQAQYWDQIFSSVVDVAGFELTNPSWDLMLTAQWQSFLSFRITFTERHSAPTPPCSTSMFTLSRALQCHAPKGTGVVGRCSSWAKEAVDKQFCPAVPKPVHSSVQTPVIASTRQSLVSSGFPWHAPQLWEAPSVSWQTLSSLNPTIFMRMRGWLSLLQEVIPN